MNKNLIAFAKFKDQLSNKQQLSNGDETFKGHVIYNFNGQSLQETLKVTILLTTIEYGRIRIDDGDIINSNRVHMDFNSQFQDYTFSGDGFLVIKGKSDRIGTYEVKIVQV